MRPNTATIPHPDRIPPIVAKEMAELLTEALEIAERAEDFHYAYGRLIETIDLLAEDESLGIETTTHDPDAERLTVLEEHTGFNTLYEVVMNTADRLTHGHRGDDGEPLRDLRKRLNLPEVAPTPATAQSSGSHGQRIERLEDLRPLVLRMEAAMRCIGAVASTVTPDEPDDE